MKIKLCLIIVALIQTQNIYTTYSISGLEKFKTDDLQKCEYF